MSATKFSVTRRDALRGVVAVAAAAGLSACGAAVKQAQGGTSGKAARGGTLHLATAAELMPAAFFQGADPAATIAGLVYERLINYAGDSTDPRPALATSWQVSADGKSVTLKLRDGVTFHSGRPFTSKDVEFSLKTYTQPARVGQMASTAAVITGYDTSDPRAITLTLAHQVSNIFDLFDVVPILDSETIAQFDKGAAYVGTGAFTFESWTPGSKIVFKASKDYWQGAPKLDGAELAIIPDPQTQVAQLRSGQVDVLLDAANRDLSALGGKPGYQAIRMTGSERSYYAGINVAAAGLGDVRVRQAINLAVDRERILSEVFLGQGSAVNLPWPDFSPAFDAKLNSTYDHDAAAARKLLGQVGPVPPVTISYSAIVPMLEQIALILQDNLRAVGLQVKLDNEDAATYTANLAQSKYPGVWLSQHAFAQYTPATLLVSAYPFNAVKNVSNFVNAGYQALARQAWEQTDPDSATARKLYGQLNADLLKYSFVIDLVNYTTEWLATDKVGGLAWSRRGEINLNAAYLNA
jgi:peptide/nickel transport system substrate-binding protein